MNKTNSPLKAKAPAGKQGADAQQEQLDICIVPKTNPHFNVQVVGRAINEAQ